MDMNSQHRRSSSEEGESELHFSLHYSDCDTDILWTPSKTLTGQDSGQNRDSITGQNHAKAEDSKQEFYSDYYVCPGAKHKKSISEKLHKAPL